MRRSSRSSALKWQHEPLSLSSMVVVHAIRGVAVAEEVDEGEAVVVEAVVVDVVEAAVTDEIVTLSASPSPLLLLLPLKKARRERSVSGL
jgi:hypothetical protein